MLQECKKTAHNSIRNFYMHHSHTCQVLANSMIYELKFKKANITTYRSGILKMCLKICTFILLKTFIFFKVPFLCMKHKSKNWPQKLFISNPPLRTKSSWPKIIILQWFCFWLIEYNNDNYTLILHCTVILLSSIIIQW